MYFPARKDGARHTMSWQAEMLGIDMEKLFREAHTERHRWVSLATGASLSGYAHDSVRRYAKQGVIASQKHRGRLMVSEKDCLWLGERRGRLSA